jgi:hypothetical protein
MKMHVFEFCESVRLLIQTANRGEYRNLQYGVTSPDDEQRFGANEVTLSGKKRMSAVT